MAELMSGGGHPEHAAALTRRLVVSDAVPERYQARLRALAERSSGYRRSGRLRCQPSSNGLARAGLRRG